MDQADHPVPQGRATQSRRQRGVTLIEVSISSVIMITIGSLLLQLHQASSQGLWTINAQGTLRMQLAQAINTISLDAQEARREGQPFALCNNLPASSTTLLLHVPSIDAAGNVIDGTFDSVCYTYVSSSRELQRTIDANGAGRTDETRTVARYLSLVSFSWPAVPNNRIQVTLTAQKTEQSRVYTEPRENGTLTAQFALRNWPR